MLSPGSSFFASLQIDRLVQERRNSIANALELRVFLALTHRNANLHCKWPEQFHILDR